MTRKPVFWILLTLASVGGIFFSFRYFSQAFPIVTLDLRMDRTSALASAKELAHRFALGPEGYEEAASFGGDQEVQVFVELEAGGTGAFQEMMQRGFYMPYTWTVRHYRPGEVNETRFFFTPEGTPYGFSVKLPEQQPGAALLPDTALTIATRQATMAWNIDLTNYALVEKSQEVRTGGRIDHSFVYERRDAKIGEGLYRLRLGVSGNRLTEVRHFVKVPEAFQRRYQEMRSANEAIGVASSLGMALLYIVGGCGIGLFFLLRQRWILWRQPLVWAGVIAGMQFLVGLNQLPLVWMKYDTAISAGVFIAQHVALELANALAMGIVFAVSFMAAESLSRKAFPHHIQQWKLWSPSIAGTKAVLGRTLAGYLLVGVFFAYEVALYFVGTQWLGWWTPSDILFHPDVLATYLPWLTSVGVSAQAGFWEESLFRAVPLAGAALLGDRFGRRSWWIAGAMLVQALIFGGGHAGYANQPAYARVVELIIPSLMFGGIYLAFGLLPAVVLHFTFDVVWFSLPLFVSTAPGVWVSQVFVVILTLVPLCVPLAARFRMKRWSDLPADALNSAWSPPTPTEAKPVETPTSEDQPLVAAVRYLPVIGGVALIVWVSFTSFKTNVPPLAVSRTEAIAIATNALQQRGIALPDPWKAFTAIAGNPGEDDRFVWQTMGREQYEALVGSYLPPPHWRVRFARFEGDVAERAEEYSIFINGKGEVFRIQHVLPEDRAGASIGEQDARMLAHLAVNGLWNVDAGRLKEVSAIPSKLKHRTDWVFTFADTTVQLTGGGEARMAVTIAGDRVEDAHKFIHVPEEWTRRERDAKTFMSIVQTGGTVVNVLLVVGAMILAVVRWSRKLFSVRAFLALFGAVFVASIVNLINGFPGIVSAFSTAQPYTTQLFILAAASGVGLLVLSVSFGLTGGLVTAWKEHRQLFPAAHCWATGISLALIFLALAAAGRMLDGEKSRLFASYDSLNTYVPVLDSIVDAFSQVIIRSLLLLFVFTGIDRLTAGWRKRVPLATFLFVLYGFVVAAGRMSESVTGWGVSGMVVGFLLLMAFLSFARFDPRVVPVAVGTITVVGMVQQMMFNAIPDAMVVFGAGAVVALGTGWLLYRGMVHTGR